MADAPAAEPTPSTPASTSAAPTPPAVTPPVEAQPATPPVEAVKPPEAPKPPEIAPEKYDFTTMKLPEGVALDTKMLGEMEPVFKELQLTQEEASKLVEMNAKVLASQEVQRETDFKEWMKNQATQNLASVRKEWGLQFDSNLQTAQRGIARVMSPAAKAMLDETGLGNHPEFLKAFLQVGKMVSEDTPPPGGVPVSTKRDPATTLYGSTTPN